MNEEKFALRQKTQRDYYIRTTINGMRRMWRIKWGLILPALTLTPLVIILLARFLIAPNILLIFSDLAVLALAVFVNLIFTYMIGHIPGAKEIYENLLRIGFTNSAGEAPLLTAKRHVGGNIHSMAFSGRGFPTSVWDAAKEKIETALNITILTINEGNSKREIIVEYVPGNIVLPRKIVWDWKYLSDKDCEIRLGESVCGPVSINLAVAPHALIGGTTGCGKTRLMESIAEQFVEKGGEVYLVDYKGVDYRNFVRFVGADASNDALLDTLNCLHNIFLQRRECLHDENCRNIEEYNTKGCTMNRILLLIDEASAVFDTTGRSKEEKETISKILGGVLELTRLGRFVGIHVIIGTQRPDVNSVPGALKANLSIRICGHMPDVATSTVILDDGAAADIPAIPGRFLLRDGGEEVIFQSYLFESEDEMK